MSYAIFRAEKIKSWGLLARSAGHMNRSRPTPNADPSRANLVLIGSGDPDADVRQHISGAGIALDGLRKNGVLAVRILATASPEFFRPDRVHRAGEWDADRLDAWQYLVKAANDIRYVTDKDKHSNVSRTTMHPLWEALLASLAELPTSPKPPMPEARALEIIRLQRGDMALKQGMGNLLNYCVLAGAAPNQIAAKLNEYINQASSQYEREIGKRGVLTKVKEIDGRLAFLKG